ncbi:MAG: hypothetical protein ACPGJV_04955 [Bacteriovoracaceae bacterium]
MKRVYKALFLTSEDSQMSEWLELLEMETIENVEALGEEESLIVFAENFKAIEELGDLKEDSIGVLDHIGVLDGAHCVKTDLKLYSKEVFRSQAGRVLISRAVGDDSSLQLEKLFADSVEDLKSFKVTSPLYTGHYSDIAFNFAAENEKDILNIRSYLTSLFTFLTYLQQGENIKMPIDVDLCLVEGAFIIQVHCPLRQFDKETLLRGLDRSYDDQKYGGLIRHCIKCTNLFDVYTLRRPNKLVFTGVWLDNGRDSSFGYKIFEEFKYKFYGSEILASQIVLDYQFNSDSEGIYLPGKFFVDETKGRWFKVINAIGIKQILEKGQDVELDAMINFEAFIEEHELPHIEGDELAFAHHAHKNEELKSLFKDAVFKAQSEPHAVENEIMRCLESLLVLDLWDDQEKKSESFNPEKLGEIAKKIQVVYSKKESPDKTQKLIMGVLMKEWGIPLENALTFSKKFIENGINIIAIKNFRDLFQDESSAYLADETEIDELKEKYHELQTQVLDVQAVNNEFEKESENKELIEKNKKLSTELENLKRQIGKKHAGFVNHVSEQGEDDPKVLKKKVKDLEGQLKTTQQRLDVLLAQKKKGAFGGGKQKKGASGAIADKNKIDKSLLDKEKQKALKERKSYETKINMMERNFNTEKLKLKDELIKLKRTNSSGAGDKAGDLRKDLKRATDDLKAQKINMKKLEVQNKQLAKQVETLKKLKAGSGKAGSGKAGGGKQAQAMERKAKQLETLYQKSQAQVNKVSMELLDKKSVLTKQKNEIQVLKNKIRQLQRKAA